MVIEMNYTVAVVGAGLSGLSAAIFCARDGHKVTVYEQTKIVGDIFPPMVFGTVLLDLKKIDKILNLNLKKVMKPVVLEARFPNSTYRMEDKKYKTYNVEIGPRKTSLNSHLKKIAKKEGVTIIRNKTIINPSKLNSDRVIIACGSWSKLWDLLKIDYTNVYAHIGYGKYLKNNDIYFGLANDNFAPGWYCHVSSMNGIISGLISSKKAINMSNWNNFSKYLVNQGLVRHFKEVKYLTGKIPNKPTLIKNNYILAGTIAGCNDPILNHGTISSLISGKISSIAVGDLEKAKSLFWDVFAKKFWLFKGVYLFDKISNRDSVKEMVFNLSPKLWQDMIWTFDIFKL